MVSEPKTVMTAHCLNRLGCQASVVRSCVCNHHEPLPLGAVSCRPSFCSPMQAAGFVTPPHSSASTPALTYTQPLLLPAPPLHLSLSPDIAASLQSGSPGLSHPSAMEHGRLPLVPLHGAARGEEASDESSISSSSSNAVVAAAAVGGDGWRNQSTPGGLSIPGEVAAGGAVDGGQQQQQQQRQQRGRESAGAMLQRWRREGSGLSEVTRDAVDTGRLPLALMFLTERGTGRVVM